MTPKFRADRRYFRSIEATADAVAVVIVKNDERKIRKIAARSLGSNQRAGPKISVAIGSQAIGEIGRRSWTGGLKSWLRYGKRPRAIPSGMPTTAASEKPHATRKTEATTFRRRTPWTRSSRSPIHVR